MKEVHVTAGVIIKDDLILCVQRGLHKYDYISNKWEFPGGKVESGEKIIDTIKRELKEELSIDVEISGFLIQVNHIYPDFKLKMDTFICKIVKGELKLTEHINFKWLKLIEIKSLDWAEADLPIVKELIKRKTNGST